MCRASVLFIKTIVFLGPQLKDMKTREDFSYRGTEVQDKIGIYNTSSGKELTLANKQHF